MASIDHPCVHVSMTAIYWTSKQAKDGNKKRIRRHNITIGWDRSKGLLSLLTRLHLLQERERELERERGSQKASASRSKGGPRAIDWQRMI